MRKEEAQGAGQRSRNALKLTRLQKRCRLTKRRGGGVGWGRVGGKGSNESGRERTGDERAEGWKEGRVEVEGKQELRLRG